MSPVGAVSYDDDPELLSLQVPLGVLLLEVFVIVVSWVGNDDDDGGGGGWNTCRFSYMMAVKPIIRRRYTERAYVGLSAWIN